MAKIAWGRGFFRVWMLLAALWLIGGAVIGYNLIVTPYVPTKVVNMDNLGSAALYTPWGSESGALEKAVTAGTAVVSEVRPGYRLFTSANVSAADLQTYRQQAGEVVDDYINTVTVAQRNAVLPTWIGWTFAPPLVLLILGWAIGWAISGFRRPAQ